MHIHTKYSGDSISEPYKIMKVAKKMSLDGVAVTDHNTVKGWKDMLKVGKRFGIRIILGEEIKIKDRQNSYEILGLFLNNGITSNNQDEVIDEIKEQGGIVSIAHPFDPYKSSINSIENLVKKIDAIEVFNSRVISKSHNKRALTFAEKHKLGMTAGSDAHTEREVGNAYTIADVDSLEDFKNTILKRETTFHGKLMSPLLRASPKIARLNKRLKKIF